METGELKDCSYKPSKMTRDKEIEKASKEFAYNISSIRPELNADSFRQGAKWADENPKNDVYRDLNGDILTLEEIERRYNQGIEYRKKKLINKACEYLESLTYQDYAGGPIERYVPDYIINGLREVMEE